jgi:hypothetical protein
VPRVCQLDTWREVQQHGQQLAPSRGVLAFWEAACALSEVTVSHWLARVYWRPSPPQQKGLTCDGIQHVLWCQRPLVTEVRLAKHVA